ERLPESIASLVAEPGAAVDAGSIHGGSIHGGSIHGGSIHGGSIHGGSIHGSDDESALVQAVRARPVKERGIVIDSLYELEGHDRAVRRLLATEPIGAPHLFRYAKSVWKRAMLRGDHATFALVSLRLERLAEGTTG